MANYAIEPSILASYIPEGTELDLWNNTCYISLVGFMFLNTRLMGVSVPFHTNFEEVNLRFYVRRHGPTGWKRGVVFLKEFVPKPALTFVANSIYGEHYQTVPMNHEIKSANSLQVSYSWKVRKWNTFSVDADPLAQDIAVGSEAEFITEHYWGYTKLGSSKTSEYAVEHPRWQAYRVTDHKIDVDFESLYGPQFGSLNEQKPLSVFLAEGSEILVRKAEILKSN